MKILGIESTCDETSASVIEDGKKILSLQTASSADIHAKYGGVFPELACRRHVEAIIPIIDAALKEAGITSEEIDAIAIAKGPGLIGALLIGMQTAKGLAIAWNKPLIGVNHVEAHLYAAMMSSNTAPRFPALGIVLSGGHTLFLHIHAIGHYTTLSTTVDDAIGEAFDKVAVLLGFPYPGGPHIEQLALKGSSKKGLFSAGKVKKNPLAFSFSGIKTSVLYAVKDKALSSQEKADIAASFQETVFQDVLKKAKLICKQIGANAIYLGGGVCNNQRLRDIFMQNLTNTAIFWPSKDLSLDNAAMIAGLGYHKFLENPQGESLQIQPSARISYEIARSS